MRGGYSDIVTRAGRRLVFLLIMNARKRTKNKATMMMIKLIWEKWGVL